MCKSCVDKITKYGKFKCPLDNKVEKRSEAFLDKIHERKVLSLKVKCNNNGHGCAWIGELRDLQKHADDGCDFAQVCCEFLSVGCSHQVCLEMTNFQIDKRADNKQACKLMNKQVYVCVFMQTKTDRYKC
ncbi:TNF receptor-associated factor 6-B-like isoform X2 [Corticium candelabrum]|nr:TNF receptor-associated factor 6-B-like isoform X2 [Corticium candelabrum]